MSNYVKATNFATKDTLPTGDSNKIVKGTEIDNEFNAIAGAISSKADLSSPSLTGTPTSTTAAAGTNTTQIATTAFVVTERTTAATLTNKTLTSPVVSGLSLTDSSIVFEGSTADNFETTLTVVNPTADRTITLPDRSGTVAFSGDITDTALFTTSGTYTIAGTTMTISASSHGRSVGDVVYLNFTSGTAVDNYFTIATVPNSNSFTITYGSSLTASGNVTGYYSNKGLISIASTDEVLAGTSTNRAATPAGVLTAIRSSIVQETAVASTSGTSISFTGIPSWAKKITVMFRGVSTSGSSQVQIQLGTGSTTYTTSGYAGSCTTTASSLAFSSGFIVSNSHGSSDILNGFASIQNLSGNNWVENSILGRSDLAGIRIGGGSVALSAALTAIRVTTVDGTDTFDAGSINIMYE